MILGELLSYRVRDGDQFQFSVHDHPVSPATTLKRLSSPCGHKNTALGSKANMKSFILEPNLRVSSVALFAHYSHCSLAFWCLLCIYVNFNIVFLFV